jgi:hypothetical protein
VTKNEDLETQKLLNILKNRCQHVQNLNQIFNTYLIEPRLRVTECANSETSLDKDESTVEVEGVVDMKSSSVAARPCRSYVV